MWTTFNGTMDIRKYILAAVLACMAVTVRAQDDYARIAELKRADIRISGLRPTADGRNYTFRTRNGIAMRSYEDKERTVGIADIPFKWIDYVFSPDERHILIASEEGFETIYRHSYLADYWLAETGGAPRKILSRVRDATFSPDGRLLAYARENDLYLFDPVSERTTAVTDDGEWNSVINGTTDWVYEEEFGFTRAYAFSPDSRRIAYLRFDESRVPLFKMMRYDAQLDGQPYTFKYPRAGETNSTVELWVYDIGAGMKRKVDVGPNTDQYISSIGWTPDGALYFFRVSRKQDRFEIVTDRNGVQKVIYDERAPQYVERKSADDVLFIDGNRFIVREETSAGYMHLYLHSAEHGLLNAVTAGDYEVTQLAGCDGKRVWYVSAEGSPLRRSLWSVKLNGKDKRKLSADEGFYAIAPSEGMKYYVSTFSNASTPHIVTVHRADGKAIDTLSDSRARVAAFGELPHKEFFTFTTERGDTLNAYMIRPLDFDPAKRYPILLTQYSGPGSQQVADRWSIDWENALVDHGYIVVCTDGRGTGLRGEKFKKSTYGSLGAREVEDQISFARHMASQPYADPERIGIYGWSYGGFTALGCALKGEGLFKMAIAVAPVTTWRYYDTIYTEIYNGLPQENPSGYDDNSPVNFADKLDGRTRLLIMHGTADDNVHLQNTIEMARALNRAGKSYDMMIYPDQNHSMLPDDTANIRRKMISYTLDNL